MKPLEGKAAIVTGSARGIGAAIAERLAHDGATVVVNYVKSAAAAASVADRIGETGGKAIVIEADVGDGAQAKGLVDRTIEKLGRLDIVVNNAAITHLAPLGSIDYKRLHAEYATNVFGPLALVEAAVPHLPQGGRVINITSLVQLYPVPATSVYAGTKGAIDAMTRAWAAELGRKGITVNAVAPGPIETDMMRENLHAVPPEVLGMFTARTLLGRLGTPADVAAVVAFLASPDAAFVTGSVLFASGGLIP